jgi:Zn-dependent M28 family amino/carboxypeptidase
VWDKDAKALPQVTMSTEQFNRISRMVQQGEKVKIELELQVKFHDNDMMQYNTVAEIPGSDKADEIVMLGAHMDSWHSGTGATDNAAGCAVAMEAVRILQTLNLRPRRTIRIALWSGEEQGLLGSRAYVSQQFATVEGGGFGAGAASRRVTRLPGWEKLSAYFNLDNGTGKIRGIYCQGNSGVKDIFQRWLQPFADLGAKTVTLGNTGSTDHASFDAVGLPGFQFIQDPVEYDTRTHHSNQDVYDRLQEADLKQAAVIMAAFVYQTAMADDKLPRKPLSP